MAKEIDKIIQSPTPPSGNVIWDDGNNLKIKRRGVFENIGSSPIEVYELPFNTTDLISVAEGSIDAIKVNLDEITNAIKDKKLIIIQNSSGITVASAKYSTRKERTFIAVLDYTEAIINIKWSDGATELKPNNITVYSIYDIDYNIKELEARITALEAK